MLSRVATSLYVLGRNVERAEHLARLVNVHSDLDLDATRSSREGFWSRFAELAGWPAEAGSEREQAIELVVAGRAGPSVLQSLSDGRRAAQAVRPSVSTEVYEQLNALYWRLQESDWRTGVHAYLAGVPAGTQRVTAPEHPGFGRSQIPDWMMSVGDRADFYLDVMKQLDLTNVHLVGHSLGGWTAAEIAIRSTSRRPFSTNLLGDVIETPTPRGRNPGPTGACSEPSLLILGTVS